MCQQVQFSHLCTHKTPGPLKICAYLSTPNHYRTVTIVAQGTLCSSCANRTYIPAVPVTYAAALPPLILIPPPPAPIVLKPAPTLPQISPGPGSHGTPLPVPPNTPTSVRWESINGRLQPVVHYHTNPTPNAAYNPANRHGYNSLHGYDPGSLPPGWGAGTNPFPTRGYNTLHGYDPGNPPPGCGGATLFLGQGSFPAQTPAVIPAPVAIPVPAPVPVPIPPQPQANGNHFANPVAVTAASNNTGGDNTQGATRPAYNSSTVATHGSVLSSETLTGTSSATSTSDSNSRRTSSTGPSTSTSGSRR